MDEFKKELKELLNKHDASIYIVTEGEGYSASYNIEIETNKGYICFDTEITKYMET